MRRAEDGSHRPRQLLAAIADRDALRVLRSAAADPESGVRAAAIASLGFSGDRSDVPLAVAPLDDDEPRVGQAARASLADLGRTDAADARAIRVDGLEDEERIEALEALARVPALAQTVCLWPRGNLRRVPRTPRPPYPPVCEFGPHWPLTICRSRAPH